MFFTGLPLGTILEEERCGAEASVSKEKREKSIEGNKYSTTEPFDIIFFLLYQGRERLRECGTIQDADTDDGSPLKAG